MAGNQEGTGSVKSGKAAGGWNGILAGVPVLLFLVMLLAAGCGAEKMLQSADAGRSGGYQVTDTQGTVLTLPHKPQRIVSLSLSSDEMLLALTGTERLAALHYLADDPGISTIAAKAGKVAVRMQEYNAEMILALHPDLVIVPDWHRAELIATLRDLGLTVFVSKGPSSVQEIKQAIGEISRAINEEESGRQVISRMDQELGEIAAAVSRIPPRQRQTVILISHMAAYGGRGSLFDDMCRHAGVINGAAAVGLGKNDALTKESIVRANPDIILTPSWSGGKLDVNAIAAELQNDPALQGVAAIQRKRLVQIPDLYLYSASQDVIQAIRDIIQAAYPQEGQQI